MEIRDEPSLRLVTKLMALSRFRGTFYYWMKSPFLGIGWEVHSSSMLLWDMWKTVSQIMKVCGQGPPSIQEPHWRLTTTLALAACRIPQVWSCSGPQFQGTQALHGCSGSAGAESSDARGPTSTGNWTQVMTMLSCSNFCLLQILFSGSEMLFLV